MPLTQEQKDRNKEHRLRQIKLAEDKLAENPPQVGDIWLWSFNSFIQINRIMNKTFEYQLLRPLHQDLVIQNEGTINERWNYRVSPEHTYPPLPCDFNKDKLTMLLRYKKYDGVPLWIRGLRYDYDN